MEIPLVIRYT